MGRERAWTAERTGSAMGVGSPLILWEGGRGACERDAAMGEAEALVSEPLGLSLESPSLFPETQVPPMRSVGSSGASSDVTAPMPRPVRAPRRRHTSAKSELADSKVVRIHPRSEGRQPLRADSGSTGRALIIPILQVDRLRLDGAIHGIGPRSLDWRLIWVSLILCLTVAIGAIAARGAVLDAAYAGLRWEDHTVVAGETIDSILSVRDLPDVGTGRLVEWVEERNGLEDATIVPGQVLSMPA